jgi:hypothetical protein
LTCQVGAFCITFKQLYGFIVPIRGSNIVIAESHPSGACTPSSEAPGGSIHFGILELITNDFSIIDIYE